MRFAGLKMVWLLPWEKENQRMLCSSMDSSRLATLHVTHLFQAVVVIVIIFFILYMICVPFILVFPWF